MSEQNKQEPVAWMFQHDETGRMNYVSNDGVHNPSTFLEMNPRYALVCPLYTTPPAQQAQQKPLAWADEIIADLHALYDSEMITENDSGDALIRLDAAICAVEEAEERHTTPPAAQPAPVQEPVAWLTGCPECGMDGGCDCDSGTWNPPEAQRLADLIQRYRSPHCGEAAAELRRLSAVEQAYNLLLERTYAEKGEA